MPPKKQKASLGQPTLKGFISNDITQKDHQSRQKRMQRQTQKLLKVRREIQQKQLQEERTLKTILKLQISQQSCTNKEEVINQDDQQYWMMTSIDSVTGSNSSLLKTMLSDYGQVKMGIQNKVAVLSKQEKEEKQQKAMQIQEAEWQQKGVLKPEYLKDFTPDFLSKLQEYQYMAQQ